MDRDVEGLGERKVVEFAHDAVKDALGKAIASPERRGDKRTASIVALESRSVEYDLFHFRMAGEESCRIAANTG